MSEEQMEEQTMSSEDKFFGVKTTFDDKATPVEDVDVEVIDDRPPEDRRPPAKEAKGRKTVTMMNWRVTPRKLKSASISSAINSMRSEGNAKPLKRCAKKLSEWRKSMRMRTRSIMQSSKKASSIWFIRFESELIWLLSRLKVSIAKHTKRETRIRLSKPKRL